MKKHKILLVIVPDFLPDLISKGELTPRYYNPGNLFDEVHLLATNDQHVDKKELQYTVGNAEFHIHYLPQPDFIKSGFYNPILLKPWINKAMEITRKISPDLVRCHGAWLNILIARDIKKKYSIPYIVSLHTYPEEKLRDKSTFLSRLYWQRIAKIEKDCLVNADIVLPVYEPIVDYLRRIGISKYQVAYNVLNEKYLKRKTDYKLHTPVRIVSVGRLIKEKTPEPLIRAVAKLKNVELTIIGQGPEENELKKLTYELNIETKVKFIQRLMNSELCSKLVNFDVFAAYTEYREIPKAVMEPLLTGLPCVVNRNKGKRVPELSGSHIMLVEGTMDSYLEAFSLIINNYKIRSDLGKKAYEFSNSLWSPKVSEMRYVNIYKKLLEI